MTLLSSFSISYFARPSEQSGYADVMLRYFSAAYTPVPIAGTGAAATLIRTFGATYSPLQTTPISIKKVSLIA